MTHKKDRPTLAVATRKCVSLIASFVLAVTGCGSSTEPEVLSSSRVDPNVRSFQMCTSLQMRVTMITSTGAEYTADSVHWSSNDPSKATVSSSGVVVTKASAAAVRIDYTAFRHAKSLAGSIVIEILATVPTCSAG